MATFANDSRFMIINNGSNGGIDLTANTITSYNIDGFGNNSTNSGYPATGGTFKILPIPLSSSTVLRTANAGDESNFYNIFDNNSASYSNWSGCVQLPSQEYITGYDYIKNGSTNFNIQLGYKTTFDNSETDRVLKSEYLLSAAALTSSSQLMNSADRFYTSLPYLYNGTTYNINEFNFTQSESAMGASANKAVKFALSTVELTGDFYYTFTVENIGVNGGRLGVGIINQSGTNWVGNSLLEISAFNLWSGLYSTPFPRKCDGTYSENLSLKSSTGAHKFIIKRESGVVTASVQTGTGTIFLSNNISNSSTIRIGIYYGYRSYTARSSQKTLANAFSNVLLNTEGAAALNIVSSLDGMQIGDLIKCKYTASSGTFGLFNNLGTSKALTMSTPSATPNGSFFLVYVGNDLRNRKILIADRNIQHTISWDELNKQGITNTEGALIHNIKTSLVAAYDFDELSGNTLYSKTTSSYNGTVTGATIVTGYSGSARSFNGTSNYISFGEKIIPLGAKTVRFKIKKSVLPSATEIIMSNANMTTEYGFLLGLQASTGKVVTQLMAGVSGTPRFSVVSSTNVCDGNWHDVMITWDGTTSNGGVKIYVDNLNIVDAQGTSSGTETTTASNNLKIGALPSNSSYFNGILDNIEIYEGVLDGSQSAFETDVNHKFNLRLLLGGVSTLDGENEWRKYIGISTLNGNITAGDNTIWNWSAIPSWTSTTSTTAGSRVVYGGAGVSALANYAEVASGTSTTGYGFRPVLIVEEVPKKYLIEDGTKIKKYDSVSGWVELGNAPATDAMINQGMDSISILTNEVLSQLSTRNPKLIASGEFNSIKTKVTALPTDKLILMNTDIDLDIVSSIDYFAITSSIVGAANVRIIVSATSGLTWGAFDGASWQAVDITNLSDVKTKGIPIELFNTMTSAQWLYLTSSQRKIRFGIYFDVSNSTDSIQIDSLTRQFDYQASWRIAKPGTDFDYEYPNNTTLRIKIFANGDYKINY